MDKIYPYYTAVWVTACLVAVVLYIRHRQDYAISHRSYRRFIFVPWKIATFLVAAVGLIVIAPYTGDPTWDYYDAAVMSVLTFLTAPWVVGAIYKAARSEVSLAQAYVAFCLWMFTTSWFYDTYILIRDGEYGPLWFENIFASSALYIFAGLLWNLDWVPGRGTIFAFMEKEWPPTEVRNVFFRIIWFGLVFMIIVALMVLWFVFPLSK